MDDPKPDLDALIAANARELSPLSILALGKALKDATLHVPVAAAPLPGQGLPVTCVETSYGAALPAFTTVARLEAWKPGLKYADVPGDIVIGMAERMAQVAGVFVDMAAQPNAWIPRSAFRSILAG